MIRWWLSIPLPSTPIFALLETAWVYPCRPLRHIAHRKWTSTNHVRSHLSLHCYLLSYAQPLVRSFSPSTRLASPVMSNVQPSSEQGVLAKVKTAADNYLNPKTDSPITMNVKYEEDPSKTMKATEWHGTQDVRVVERPAPAVTDPADAVIRIAGDELSVTTASGERRFDSVYPALGSHIRSELAVAAGAAASEDGCLEVDDHQQTSVPGLFAAGDVVLGLDQISNAMGQAGVAATKIRNLLDERRPIRR